MTLVHESRFPIAEPRFYAVGAHAPLVADRTLREEHADLSALLLLGSEIAHAAATGHRRWASQLDAVARRRLPSVAGSQSAGLYRAELSLLRSALTGTEPGTIEYAVCSEEADSYARAEARATELVLWRAVPHPAITGWLAWCAVVARRGDRSPLKALRRHLICYGIDPTDVAAVEATHAHPQRRWLYVGVLVEAGAYLPVKLVSAGAGLGRGRNALSWREAWALRRARAVEVTAAQWQDRMVEVIDGWTAHIPGDAR